MSIELTFCGYSDDTAVCDMGARVGVPDLDHDDCARGSLRVFRVEADGEALLVGVQYSPADSGTWMVGIMQSEECVRLPPWPMRWDAEGCTTRLNITVPDSATVSLIKPEATHHE